MIFNSVEFAIFFPIVFLLYWLVCNKNTKVRNSFIVLVSYFFYGVWDWRFLSLIIISSFADFFIGRQLGKEQIDKRRKYFLLLSLGINIGFLAFFKYFNFFADSFVSTFSLLGADFSFNRLKIILPVGISFYTFQTLSYTIDIYNRKMEPTKDVLGFLAFVSFFPQLVAGPIERARDLLPQFSSLKTAEYNNIKSGLILMALGLFKKIVIADRLAVFVDSSYSSLDEGVGVTMIFAVVFFAFQLYLDFSAYSDIAIGIARTLGFNLSTNFNRPYLASSFSDFWNRWHISLSSWFRDYVYIPLGGSKVSKYNTIRNVMVVFILSGLWHGASWNFVIWGALNGLFLVGLDPLVGKFIKVKILKSTFVVVCWILSLVFFRAETLGEAITAFSILDFKGLDQLYEFGLNKFEFKLVCILLFFGVLIEYLKEKNTDVVAWIISKPIFVRYSFYVCLITSILLLGSYGVGLNDKNFIYFQF